MFVTRQLQEFESFALQLFTKRIQVLVLEINHRHATERRLLRYVNRKRGVSVWTLEPRMMVRVGNPYETQLLVERY